MRVLVVGGAGEMGRQASRTLATMKAVHGIIVADLQVGAACAVADEIRSDRCALATVETAEIDVTRGEDLRALMDVADVVVNAVGPFYRFGVDILTAAIDAGKDYVDICDDPDPTLTMLELDEYARNRGVTALVGMGASPGVANLLAVLAAQELDSVDEVVTGWNIDDAISESPGFAPSAALVHGIEQITGTIPTWSGEQLTRRPALERVAIDYPGLGRFYGRTFGHPEAVTIQRAIPTSRSVNVVVGDAVTLGFLRTIRVMVDRKVLDARVAARIAAIAQRLRPAAAPADLLVPGGPPPLFAVATGLRNGVAATAATALAGIPGMTMAANTGVPLAVSVPIVAAAADTGVHTPETLLDPCAFFAALAEHCIGRPRPEDMALTTRSWVNDDQNATELGRSLITALLVSR